MPNGFDRMARESGINASVAAVVIGRNEGERLKHCLASLLDQAVRTVYVDSGSTDGSVAHARALGIEVVELDTTAPFTAARGRNAGFAALTAKGPLPDYVQFVDGDCAVAPGWIAAAAAHLDAAPDLGIVTGWRSEIHRDRSIYNAMCDVEWHRPAGEIETCGGDMMVRSDAFVELNGLRPHLIAGEDEEFCLRMRQSGRRIERLPLEMTYHDAGMTRFSQWWRRSVRTGHGFAQIGTLYPHHWRAERRRVWIYGLILPVLAMAGILLALAGRNPALLVLPLMALGAYALSWLRTCLHLIRADHSRRESALHALFLTLSKFPNLIGMKTYYWRRWRSREMRLIEYK